MKKVSVEVDVVAMSELLFHGESDFDIEKYPDFLRKEFEAGRMEVRNYGLVFKPECRGYRFQGDYPFQAMRDDSVINVPGEGIVIMKSVDAEKIWK